MLLHSNETKDIPDKQQSLNRNILIRDYINGASGI